MEKAFAARLRKMNSEDRFYHYGQMLIHEVGKHKFNADKRFQAVLPATKQTAARWYKREAAARRRLVLKLVRMIEEFEL
jgi:hypothetical protein